MAIISTLASSDCGTVNAATQSTHEILINTINTPNLTDILNDEDDFDIESQTIINESKYYDLDELTAKMINIKNNFSVLNLNIESINAKWDLLVSILTILESQEIFFSAITLQETWLDEDPKIYELKNYESYDQPRTSSQRGGLKTFIRQEFQSKKIDIYKKSEFWDGLFVEVKDKTTNKKIIVSNVYKPPKNNNNNENIQNFISEISPILDHLDTNNNIILCGDFNIDLLKINENEVFNIHFDNIINRGFLPFITNPTRFARLSASLLDHIYIKSTLNSNNIFAGILTSKISDHMATIASLPLMCRTPEKPKYVTICKNNLENQNKIQQELSSIDWNNLLKTRIHENPEKNYEIIMQTITNIKNKHMPKKQIKFNFYKHKIQPWINQDIINNIKHKDKLYILWKKTSINNILYNQHKENFRNCSEKLKKLIFTTKREYYSKLFQKYKSDIKNTWLTIKNLINKNRIQKNLPNKFNDFFVNTGINLNNSIILKGRHILQTEYLITALT